MYGMVHRGMADMVRQTSGDDAWQSILRRAGAPGAEFLSTQAYPDELTYGLVAAACEELSMAAPDLLREFGRYWVVEFAATQYGAMLDAAGSDVPTLLGNLNALHSRAGMVFRGYHPPRFAATAVGERQVELHYFSVREGLVPFVMGLVEGVGERFGTPVAVVHDGRVDDHEVFTVSW